MCVFQTLCTKAKLPLLLKNSISMRNCKISYLNFRSKNRDFDLRVPIANYVFFIFNLWRENSNISYLFPLFTTNFSRENSNNCDINQKWQDSNFSVNWINDLCVKIIPKNIWNTIFSFSLNFDFCSFFCNGC